MTRARFTHRAMATEFEIVVAGEDATYTAQAARAAFEDLDHIESQLSRFVPSSDVARLSRLASGEAMRVGPATLDCLALARELHEVTGGAFDPTVGPLVDAWREIPDGGEPTREVAAEARARVGLERLVVDPGDGLVAVRGGNAPGLDFGALGKGYALDSMAERLGEWGIASALLQAGQSTALALDAPPPGAAHWRVGLRHPTRPDEDWRSVELLGRALSGSGRALHGPHIMDPRTGRPSERHTAAWAWAPDAARADALSTAFMVMSREAIRTFCAARPEIEALDAPGEKATEDDRLKKEIGHG